MSKTKYIILYLIFFLFVSQHSFSQPVWDSLVLEKANTAKDTRYLKDEEKQIIFYTNLARADGKLFSETYLKWYMESEAMWSNSFVQSLEQNLRDVRDLPMLVPDKYLYDIARDHAVKSGKSGQQGHQGFKKRFRKLDRSYVYFGENCYYGRDNPLVIVIRLLIDDEVPDLGHRKNMLEPLYNSIGISIMPHKTFSYNCVMDFGMKREEMP